MPLSQCHLRKSTYPANLAKEPRATYENYCDGWTTCSWSNVAVRVTLSICLFHLAILDFISCGMQKGFLTLLRSTSQHQPALRSCRRAYVRVRACMRGRRRSSKRGERGSGAMLDVVIDDDVSHDDERRERERGEDGDERGAEKRRDGERRIPLSCLQKRRNGAEALKMVSHTGPEKMVCKM